MEGMQKKQIGQFEHPSLLGRGKEKIKITNITFTKEDDPQGSFCLPNGFSNQSQFDFLLNYRTNLPHATSHKSFKLMITRDKQKQYLNVSPFHKKHHHKCSHQTKISDMFFIKSMNLMAKPPKPAGKQNCNDDDLKENQKRDSKINKFSQAKLNPSQIRERLSIYKPKSVLNLPLEKRNHSNILQPINNRHGDVSPSMKDLKKTSLIAEGSNFHKQKILQRPSVSHGNNTLSKIHNNKVSETISTKLQQITNVKDSLLQTKLTKYWQDLEQTAQLHNVELYPLDYQKNSIKYYLGKGNNSRLIRQLMKKRWWWGQSDDKSATDVYLVWMQLKDKDYYSKGSSRASDHNRKKTSKSSDSFSTDNIGNPNEDTMSTMSSSIENKQNNSQSCISNMNDAKQFTSKSQRSYHKYSPSEQRMTTSSAANNSGTTNNSQEDLNQTQNTLAMRMLKNKPIRQQLMMHNHFEHNEFLGNKKALYYNMRQYYESVGRNVFDYLPLTFHVHSTTGDDQFTQFRQIYEEELNKTKRKRLWILKPGQNSNRGKGITIHSDIDEIIAIIQTTVDKDPPTIAASNTLPNTNGQNTPQQNSSLSKQDTSVTTNGQNQNNKPNLNKMRTFIIQQYIERPFLYNKRKFDIRCYILLVSLNGLIKGYWYKEGYIRTSCYEFSLDTFNNSFIHLTNDAIQKNCEEYGKYQTGNKLSYQVFKRYLANKYPNKKYNFDTQIQQKIRLVAIDSIKAAHHMLTSNKTKNKTVFEIFGLDFMIDQNFNPWLIEVNTNPCLETSCPVLQKVIPKMLDDAFKLSIDVIYPPPQQWPSGKKHHLGSTGSNGFELVFQEEDFTGKQEEETTQKNYKKGRYQVEGIGEIEQDDEIYEQEQEQ